MKIINFEDVKTRKQSDARKQSKIRKQSKVRNQPKQNIVKPSPATDNGISELQRQYQELAQFYNQWYDEHQQPKIIRSNKMNIFHLSK